jgi:cobyrinic acid a,c-diamide synthase
VLSGSARFTEKLTLGYRDAVALGDSPLHRAGERVTGHEFHRTTVTFDREYPSAWAFRTATDPAARDGALTGGLHAGYLHTHPAAHPHAIARFVATAATSRLGA